MAKNARKKRKCKRKRTYKDQSRAVKALLNIQGANPLDINLSSYKCPYCKKWHLGHRSIKLKFRKVKTI